MSGKFIGAGVAVLVACAGFSGWAGEPVPVVNSGFEKGKVGWWGEGKWEIVQDQAAEGTAALKVTAGYVCQDKRPVTGGQRYKVSMQIRSEGAPEGAVFVQSSYRGPGVEPTWYGPVSANGEAALLVTGGTHGWKPFSVVVEAPEGATEFLLYLRKANGSAGAAWYDAVRVEPTDEPAAEAAASAAAGPVIANGDFEKGKAGWWGQGAWDVAAGQGVDGGAALRVDKGFVCQDKRPVKGRKNYRISMQVRADGTAEGAVFVQTAYRNGNKPVGSWHGPLQVKLQGRSEPAVVVTGGTHGWKPFSIVVTAPPTATQLLLYLRKQDGDGSAWYDDVKVEPTDEKAFTIADRRAAELAAELLPPAPAGTDAAAGLAAAVTLGAGPVPAKITLATGGRAAYRLHVGDGEDVAVLGAVKELAACLKQITGAEFAPISHDANPAAGPLLIVGHGNALAPKLCPDVAWDKLASDEFVIRNAGPHLVIAGGTPRATMYGVYWFLDHKLGMRWLSPGYTFVPATPDLTLPPQNERQAPRFSYREVLSDEGSNPAFAAHNLLNGRSHGPSFAPTAPALENWEHDWMAMGGSANFFELLPQKTYGKAHPEWYSGGQLAMMNKEMRKAMAGEIIARLKAHPDYTKIWYNVWQMDWGWDMDPASQAFAKAHGGHASAPRLDMMTDVANQVRAVLPGARFAMQAYTWGFTPPDGMTVPDYLLIFPMTLHVDYSTPLNKGRNEKLGADIVTWTKLAKNVQIWDHIANWAGFIQPTPNIYPIGESIQWLSTLPGVRGYFCEGDWNSAGGEFGALRAWMIARLTWDPGQDPKALVDDWCRHYYGQAGPMVRDYIGLMHAAAARSGDFLGQRYMPDLAMYDLDFVMASDRLFDQAEAAVAGDAVMLAHVRHARMPVDYLVLVRRGEFAAAAAARGVNWQVAAAERRARFDQGLAENKIREYRQGGSVKELATLLDVERKVATPDPAVKNLAKSDWADIQDLAFMRFDTAAIVADPAASDGAAIRMSGKSSTWAAQLQLSALPKSGEWDLYAAVRVEAEPGHESEPGVRVGSAPPMGLFNTGKIGDLGDGAYHLVKVPGGPHHWEPTNPLRSIYIQAPAKAYITFVYIDRIIAIRHQP